MTTRFEWDPAKAASNLRKPGVSFETAVGSMGGVAVLVVVHTVCERDEDGREIEIVRIISARRADRAERRRFERETREF